MTGRASIAVIRSSILTPLLASACLAAPAPAPDRAFLDRHCVECHDADSHKGGLDLTALTPPGATSYPRDFATWVAVHDRAASGEMPPAKKKTRPEPRELARFTNSLATVLSGVERQATEREGRATQRRLNRYEYENTLRDLLSLPYLEVKDFLPEDTESHGFNKLGDALDVSYVQMSRYLTAADYALRRAMAPRVARPATTTQRFYTWDQGEFFGAIKLEGPKERRTFPLVGLDLQRDLMAMAQPKRSGEPDAARREKEALGVVVSTYEPTEIRFGKFRAPVSGRYKLRVSAYSFWIDPKFTNVTVGRRDEPVTLYSDSPPRLLRRLGSFDVTPQPGVREIETWLQAGETIRPDAARLHRNRPPDHRNPFTTPEGMPGVAFQWLEVEGPLLDQWPPAGHQFLFGDLPMEDRPVTRGVGRGKVSEGVVVNSAQPDADASRLLRQFLGRALRHPVKPEDAQPFEKVFRDARQSGHDFTESLLAGYTAILCSPRFLYLNEPTPGRLADHALAERLSYFLWNSPPDDELRRLADRGRLHSPGTLRAQVNRMLDDPRSRRFVDAFLDYWLELRGIANTAPDTELYPDYQLDDLLVESMTDETQLYFAELLRKDLAIENLVESDFSVLNERLATHYGIPGVAGVALRPVKLPADSVRGGLLTQASVLKVTANGTTTSPVKRGAWIMSRIVGRPSPPPPASVPAVEPDIRGATTIREQLAKHRNQESCNVCHRNIDPAGFALESFDVMGGWRERYRAVGGGEPVKGIGHNGLFYHFGLGQPVDPSGELPDGRKFENVRQLKHCLAMEPEQLARNLARQFIVYATGAPIRFSDRAEVEKIVKQNRQAGYGVRTLVQEVVASDLFLKK